MPNTKKKSGLTPRVVALIVAALLVANMVLGFVLARQSENALAEQAQARMLDVSNSAATLLNGDELATLTAQDAGSPAYDRAMSTLRAFQDSVELSYIYCVRERPDGTFEFTVDPTVGDPADFGEDVVYTEALGRAAKGEKEVDTTPYTDRWGTFYSSYSPVFDSNGKVASIVVVDFPAAWFEDRANFFTRIAVVDCLASLVMALIAAHVAVRLARSEKRNVKNMERAHHYEGLTGLPNMGYFCEIAEPARDKLYAEGKTPTILYMDLVDMKYFNHKFGFAEGDKLLRAFAQYLAEQFGHEHCSRFGQDHFVVGTTDEGLDERLDAFFEGCKRVNGGNSLPVSVGVYRDVSGQVSIGEACDRARLACMRSGAGYESRYVYFTDDMVEETSLRQHVLENFDRALDEGWIQVYYQPIVRSSTGKVCDEEALARWNDPERGLLSPDVFIPVLEDAKLIHKLDLHVLDRVLEKMARVADAGLFVVPTSLNLSRFDFEVCDIVDEVTKRVDASRFGRDMINIEITETALGRGVEFMREQVARFHRRGFEVWMDDFGSEYSSLDYLQRLKFDLIKFDMSFMQQFGEGDRSRIILTELVKMAFGLGVDTVVEGVETQEQVDFLREVGCSMLQGYFYTKPLPLEAVFKRYEDGTAIGFENPEESGYYAAVGRVNLYDLSSVIREGDESFGHYFDTLPMAVIEATDDRFVITRCNKSYRDFVERANSKAFVGRNVPYVRVEELGGSAFLQGIQGCRGDAEWMSIDEAMHDGSVAHAFMRRIAVNPRTGAAAIVLAVLDVVEN